MNKLWMILNSRVVVILLFLLITPFWIAFVAETTIKQSFPWAASIAAKSAASGLTEEARVLTGAQKIEMLKNVNLELVKVVDPDWSGEQKAIFKLNNSSKYPIAGLTINVIFYDAEGVLLQSESSTHMSNAIYLPEKEQYLTFGYNPKRSKSDNKVYVGLAKSAKANLLHAGAIH